MDRGRGDGVAVTEQVWITLITAMSALGVAGVTAYFTYKQNAQIFELKDKLEHQQEQINTLKEQQNHNRSVIDGWRNFWRSLVAWFNKHGLTDYPVPDDKLLDTGEHKAVK